MSTDIKEYIMSCAACNLNKKPNRIARAPLQVFRAGIPMERVHLDFLGPLPKTRAGNEYILVMVDQFTKWVECIPLPSQTAEVTAKAVIDNFFTRFGCLLHILTDQGCNFESRFFGHMCELLEMHKTRTMAYRSFASGKVQ